MELGNGNIKVCCTVRGHDIWTTCISYGSCFLAPNGIPEPEEQTFVDDDGCDEPDEPVAGQMSLFDIGG